MKTSYGFVLLDEYGSDGSYHYPLPQGDDWGAWVEHPSPRRGQVIDGKSGYIIYREFDFPGSHQGRWPR